MIDNVNPTNQFHPYQRVNHAPNAEKADEDPIDKAREYVKSNPGVAFGALAALAIGAALIARWK